MKSYDECFPQMTSIVISEILRDVLFDGTSPLNCTVVVVVETC